MASIDVLFRQHAVAEFLVKQEDLLRSHSLVSAIACLFVSIIVLTFLGNE